MTVLAGSVARRSPGPALFALALGTFAIGMTEFVITGLLPEIASDFSVSIPHAGLLVSGYALSVLVGAPVVTVVATRWPRKRVLVSLLALFVAGNGMSALAGTFAFMLSGRVVAALCHGAFIGFASIVAGDLVAPDRRTRAIGAMLSGLTIANVAGVPLGTLLGQHLGWRSTFWAMSALGVAAAAATAAFVPSMLDRAPSPPPAERVTPRDGRALSPAERVTPRDGRAPSPAERVTLSAERATARADRAMPPETVAGSARHDAAALRRPAVWLALAMTALGFGAVYAPFTYIAPLMTDTAGFAATTVPWLLALFGGGLVLGNVLGARAADHRLMPTIITALTAITLMLVVFAWTAHDRLPAAITLFALGTSAFAAVPGLTMRVITSAGGDSRNLLASSAAVSAFNLGNATGAYAGGLAITHGYGYAATPLVGAAMSAGALVIAVLSVIVGRPSARPVPDLADPNPSFTTKGCHANRSGADR